MRAKRWAAGLLMLAAGTAVAARVLRAHGQENGQAPLPSAGTLRVQTKLVSVFATVRDKHNGIIDNLTKDDFHVSEDGVEQKVAFFGKEADMPITLALLVDTSYGQRNLLDFEKDAATTFVHQVMRKKDEAVVISFDISTDLLADFTEDPDELIHGIRRARLGSDSSGIGGTPSTVPSEMKGTNLYDAVYLACHDELQDQAGRKALIVFSDGEDNSSQITFDEAAESAQRSDAVVHTVLISDPGTSEGYGVGVANRLARETGGRVFYAHNENSLEKAYDTISEELRSQYVLGYYPTNTAQDGTFRKIKVTVTQPDTKILARQGYYAPGN